MSDKTSISGPVKIEESSAERVAFELMKFIRESAPERQDEILTLYARCLLITKNPEIGVYRSKTLVGGRE